MQVMASLLCDWLIHSGADFRAATIRRMEGARYSLWDSFPRKKETAKESRIAHIEGNHKQDYNGGQLLVQHVRHVNAEAGLRQCFLFQRQIHSTQRERALPLRPKGIRHYLIERS